VARARRREARSLWHRGWQLTQIAAELGVKYGTLAAWKSRDGWDEDAPIAVVEDRLEAASPCCSTRSRSPKAT
jgi:uncharacterized protein YjcR